MWVHILGSAAGGGFPQWNCDCLHCHAVRSGSPVCRPRTQSSVAVSADYRHWFLFNASPDIGHQIAAFPALWPCGSVRHTPIQGIILSDAELDHTLGLLVLREAACLRVYTTSWVYKALTEWNTLLRTLDAYCRVDWQPIHLGASLPLRYADGEESGLLCTAFSTGSTKAVAFAGPAAADAEACVGYRIFDARSGHTLVYAPAIPGLYPGISEDLGACDCLLIDGTCWHDDELAGLGISHKTARAMGHLPIAGEGGSLELLATLDIPRTVYIHINNTNPLLIDDSPQRRAVVERGIEVAFDGMEIEV